ncbi:MAG: cyclic pyranopterin monophosphate synthase MoaC [Planctomycetes bacterium]|nr:cyclic pyranopterin monophosphate synthase MoaC [Planctomycetota bacterium]
MAKRSARSARVRSRRTRLSHVEVGPQGARACMVDVGKKIPEQRSALARAVVRFPPGLRDLAWSGRGPKGPIEEVARCAGLLAAKRVAELIPLCHTLALEHLELVIEPREGDLLEVRCRASTTGKTGVEMEALTGAAVAALTIYDMTKALDKGIVIERLELREKTGGKSGGWRAAGE